MKKQNNQKIFLLSVLLILILALGMSMMCFNIAYKNYKIEKKNLERVFVYEGPDCSNLSFISTAICLNDYVRTIFIYNETNDNLDLSLNELINRGGDCKNWADFYLKAMNYYGYNQDNKIITGLVEKGNLSTLYHTTFMSFDKTGYCHFDMEDLECWSYMNSEGEVYGL